MGKRHNNTKTNSKYKQYDLFELISECLNTVYQNENLPLVSKRLQAFVRHNLEQCNTESLEKVLNCWDIKGGETAGS